METPGYDEPNYTQTPNPLFDEHMRRMGEAELRVVLCAVRKTFGYHKLEDGISLTQFIEMTGLSRQGVIDGITAATNRGIMYQSGVGKRGIAIYALRIIATSQASRPVKPVDQSTQLTRTSQASRPEPVKPVDPQKKGNKEKKKDISPAAQTTASPAKPLRQRNPLFDAVAWYLFGAAENDSAAVKAVAPSVNKLVTFLKSRSVEVTPEVVAGFTGWCIVRKQDMKFMRYLATFTPAWLEYEEARSNIPAPAAKPEPAATEADKAALRPSLRDGMVQL